jgi:hypothetical protein
MHAYASDDERTPEGRWAHFTGTAIAFQRDDALYLVL